MNILLINPQRIVTAASFNLKPSPPLGLAYIAGALIRHGHKVDVIDCIAECDYHGVLYDEANNLIREGISFEELRDKINKEYDLIGLSIMFSNNWLLNRDLINFLKSAFPSTYIVAGGEHVTAVPEYCLKDCAGLDFCVVGEGEETIVELCEALIKQTSLSEVSSLAFRTGDEIRISPRRMRIKEIDIIPEPAWEVFPLEKYFEKKLSYGIQYGNSIPIMATRGCPYRCTFCSSPLMWGTRYYMRTPEDVLEEVKKMYYNFSVTNFDFYDLTAIIKREWILEFCDLLIKEGLKITWQIPAGTRSEAIDMEVAQKLYNSGCRNITYAPESGSKETLKRIKKKVNLDNMLRSINDSYKSNMNVKLNIIVGFPDETLYEMFLTLVFLVKASYYGAHDASPGIFSPYPGSELFDQLEMDGSLKLGDPYFTQIALAESFTKFKSYNKKYPKWVVFMISYLGFFLFYSSNYIFRPIRFFRLIKNAFTGNAESRGEWALQETIKRIRMQKEAAILTND
jgi:anaerobic magnesium-protoporphyrin IX monomethyl ester cyclase